MQLDLFHLNAIQIGSIIETINGVKIKVSKVNKFFVAGYDINFISDDRIHLKRYDGLKIVSYKNIK